MIVFRSTSWSIVTDHGEPRRTAVIASDRGNRGTAIQLWCTATTSRLTVKIFTRDTTSWLGHCGVSGCTVQITFTTDSRFSKTWVTLTGFMLQVLQ